MTKSYNVLSLDAESVTVNTVDAESIEDAINQQPNKWGVAHYVSDDSAYTLSGYVWIVPAPIPPETITPV
jgi:hypothetical protein